MLFCSSKAIFCRNIRTLSTARSPVHIMSRQMRPLSRNSDSEMEVVEDSEPERVQLRSQSRKPASDTGLQQRNTLASGMHRCRPNSAGLHTTATVIEISDSESSSLSSGEDAVIYGSAVNAAKSVKDPQQGSSKSISDLKKFAFKPLITKQQVHPVEPSLPLQPDEARPPERRRGPKKVGLNLDFLLSDIARVSRCVCCSISWTTRKSAAQKLDHIQRCAKKNGHDNETVRILIKNECASSKESNIGHCKAPTTHSTSTTLLEDVVRPRSNKRKKAQPRNHLSVGSPLRETILSRAKDILAGPSPDEASPQPSTSQKFGSDIPLTQAFTASTLIQGSSKPSLFSATSQGDEYLPETFDEALDTVTLWTNQSTLSPTDIGIGKLPTCSPNTIKDDSGRGDYRKDVNQVDVQRDLFQVTPQKVPIPKVNKGRPQSLEKSIQSGTPLKKAVAPAKLRKVRSSTKKKALFGKEWETFMKECIRQDSELSLRVIRYEPLDFNLFLNLAKAYAPSSSETTLKSHLRRFLDKQAINFYEGKTLR